MDQTFYLNLQTIEDIRVLLLSLQQHGQLKFLSCRATNENMRSTDEVSKTIMYYLKDRLGMYNIKIFIADNDFNTKYNFLPTFITCYKYLLLNTNFSSQYLLKKDMRFGHVVGIWPKLSPCLFVQILWYSQCEDLLIESLVHIPLDLCVEILQITIEHINELTLSRARRLILLLIYKIYYKCLWLHLVKNILQCIKKCTSSKIKNYLENYDQAMLFRLTCGNFNEHTNYYHILSSNEVKSIIITLDQKLITLLLNQIKHVDPFECTIWRNIVDDENTMISLHRAIIMECHYLREFMKQNNILMKNEQLFLCLKQLIELMKSEESILTLQELCYDIAKGKLHGIKELIKRYKEWDLKISGIHIGIENIDPSKRAQFAQHHITIHGATF
ncbi:PREDICTED: uncharacterized protein LOC105620918 [Atta cephalotes]|uniref:Uncharacterized protein n=1 Tax=Atta cephalotes TaxID=12957 RepID=A0A158NJS6_ATTCE|nr:PREDICTED: uncharacterized protein LOC105620918 [Atta cephalotes]